MTMRVSLDAHLNIRKLAKLPKEMMMVMVIIVGMTMIEMITMPMMQMMHRLILEHSVHVKVGKNCDIDCKDDHLVMIMIQMMTSMTMTMTTLNRFQQKALSGNYAIHLGESVSRYLIAPKEADFFCSQLFAKTNYSGKVSVHGCLEITAQSVPYMHCIIMRL